MIARRSRAAATLVLALTASGFVACLPPTTRGAGAGASAVPETSGSPSIAPTTPPAPSFGRPTPTPAPTFLVYTVKAGDNLNSIAHQFGTSGRSIAYWNGATYPSLDPESPQYQPGLLKVGWTLQIIPNVMFDEQTLPEPSDLIDDTPSEEPEASDAAASADDY
ncbi:MAG: LysM peptidoglycan-binding domain-containing protein [Chloroflexota bacterium]